MGYVPQQSGLSSSVSVQDVVAQGRYAHRGGLRSARGDEAVREALGRTGLLGMRARAFHTLSGGEQRRVLLARALATGARVLLLDEPTAGLDVAHVLRFFGLIRELKSDGYAIISVLHDLSDVRAHADEALVLRDGTTHSWGPVVDVIADRAAREVYGVALQENAALGYRLLGEQA
jgi:ABC-type cobalamin/Fe3+-siderophores transport system ATPase subunit